MAMIPHPVGHFRPTYLLVKPDICAIINPSNYRLDRILDLHILDEPAMPFSQLKWANGKTLDLATYMREHPYMYSSDNIHACLRISKSMISDVIDLFGSEVDFGDETDTHVTMTICANEMAVEHFAKTFAPNVTVLQPASLAQRVVASLEQSLANSRALCSPVV